MNAPATLKLDQAATVIEDDLARAMALNDLAAWITAARDYIERIRGFCDYENEVSIALKRRHFAFNAASWSDPESLGLDFLHQTIWQHLNTIKTNVGLGDEGSKS